MTSAINHDTFQRQLNEWVTATTEKHLSNTEKMANAIAIGQSNKFKDDVQKMADVIAKAFFDQQEELDISNHDLTSLPSVLKELTSVKVLRIGGNEFEEGKIPEVVFSMTGLTALYVNYSQVTELSAGIGNLVNLLTLNLNDNYITSLPDEIGNLTRLVDLELYSNELVAIPHTIGNLKKLKELYLGARVLNELPEEMGDLESLELLHIPNTQNLTTLPMTMKKCAKLKTILIDEMDPNPFLVDARSAILSKV